MFLVLFTYLLMVQSPESYEARHGDPMKGLTRRLERLEQNVSELRQKVAETLDKFEAAEKKKMRRQAALTHLIRAIAEVRCSLSLILLLLLLLMMMMIMIY